MYGRLRQAALEDRRAPSWPSTPTSGFVSPLRIFDFCLFRRFFLGSGLGLLKVDPLFQLGHYSSKVLVMDIQDLAHFRAGPHGFLVCAPSFGEKRKLFHERSSVLGELLDCFCVHLHGW
jgi:hypothetical protein